MTQNETNTEKSRLKIMSRESVTELWGDLEGPNIRVTGVPKGRTGTERVFKEIMAKFLKFDEN